MNADTVSYWRRNVDFPNQTTADQFFDEEQLEAYRELGMGIAQTAVQALKGEYEPWDEPMTALRKHLRLVDSPPLGVRAIREFNMKKLVIGSGACCWRCERARRTRRSSKAWPRPRRWAGTAGTSSPAT